MQGADALSTKQTLTLSTWLKRIMRNTPRRLYHLASRSMGQTKVYPFIIQRLWRHKCLIFQYSIPSALPISLSLHWLYIISTYTRRPGLYMLPQLPGYNLSVIQFSRIRAYWLTSLCRTFPLPIWFVLQISHRHSPAFQKLQQRRRLKNRATNEPRRARISIDNGRCHVRTVKRDGWGWAVMDRGKHLR